MPELSKIDIAILSDMDRFKRFTKIDNDINLKMREAGVDNVEVRDTLDHEQGEAIFKFLDFYVREKHDPISPISQIEKAEAMPKPKGYFASKVLPDAARFVAETINDGIAAAYFMTGLPLVPAPPGQEQEAKFIPRLDVETQEGQGITGLSTSKQSFGDIATGYKEAGQALGALGKGFLEDPHGAIKALGDFAVDAPVSAAAMAFPVVVGGTAKLAGLRKMPSFLPESFAGFLSESGQVVRGAKNYTHMHLSQAADNFKDAKKTLRKLRSAVEGKGKAMQVVKSLDPDKPGLNIAIYDPDVMAEAMKGYGVKHKNDKSVVNFVRDGLKGPERYNSDYYKEFIKPLYSGNSTIVGKIPYKDGMRTGDFLRSPQRLLARAFPQAGEVARKARDILMRHRVNTDNLRIARDDYYDALEAQLGKEGFGRIVAELDKKANKMGDAFDLDLELSKLPENVRPGVKRHDELMGHVRDLVIESQIEDGVPEELARQWGQSPFYFTKLFRGNFEIHGRMGKGGPIKQLDRATNEGTAYKTMERLAEQGATDLHLKFDNALPTEIATRLPRKAIMKFFNLMEENSGIDIDQLMEYAKKNGIPVLAPTESKKRNFRFAKQRKTIEGADFEFTDFDYRKVTDTYLASASRYLAMSEWRREYNRLKNRIPQTMTKLHAYLDRFNDGIEGRRFAGSENFDTFMGGFADKLNKGLEKSGVGWRMQTHPYALERLTGLARSVQANLKLGTPRAVAINALQTAQTLYPRVGARIFEQAWRESLDKDVIKRATEAGVTHMRTTVDVGGRQLSRKAGASGAWERVKEQKFLTGFSEVENRNRIAAFRAGEIEAKTAKGRYVARKLGMDPKAPDFVKQYAIDMVSRTQFDLSPADMPRWMQHPISQTLLQFKPFQLKYLESIADLRNQPDALKAAARFTGALGLAGGAKSVTSPVQLATTWGIWKVYKELRDSQGEEVADLVMYGVPGLIGMDLTNSLNIDLVPTFGRTTEEKILNWLGGPTLSDVIDMVDFSGLEKKDKEAVFAYIKKLVPQIKWGDNIWQLIQDDKYLRDNRGKPLARTTAVDKWLEALSFSTVDRSLAYTGRYGLRGDKSLARDIRDFARD